MKNGFSDYETDHDDIGQSDNDIINKDQNLCSRLKSLINNKNYLLVVCTISILYYIITGI